MDLPISAAPTASDSGAYSDLNRLNALKTGDRDSTSNLKKVAQEFEALFVSQMLKSMRSANQVLAKDNPMNTSEMRQYQEMYDQQLSVTMSRQGGGIGLQDVLMRQLSKIKDSETAPSNTVGNLTALAGKHTDLKRSNLLHPDVSILADKTDSDADAVNVTGLALKITQRPLWATRSVAADHRLAAASASSSASPHNDVAKLNARRLALPSSLADRLLAGIVPTTSAALSQAGAGSAISGSTTAVVRSGAAYFSNGDWTQNPALTTSGSAMQILGRSMAQPPLAPSSKTFASQDAFVATMLPLAKDAAARIGVDPTVLVAQAALETGWGKSIMRQQDGSNSHNLFGIKAQGGWQGPEARAITSEFRDGQMIKETADFRSYGSYADSFHDLVTVLQNNNRYQGVLKSADNPEQFVKELQKAGYATDPDYASKISQIAKQMKSYQNYAAASSSTTL
ncbi:flagellar assembly peptidoglycan hydrolase FlgJ [Pseudomonas sp. 10B1]|uniref:flagellar assembly peptidoglycan hydrolase FlgJ n=1 Tax=unclassified Pseudomonas TaxID=196821 RepID=UPI002AB55D98|nr:MULTISPECIES: flagellar assembly peptidoglycan hydrolase FlgJ [unclassified Pseudomonas]MDY7560770.1 flagellar assembly peptidoglycan hydrolase FlgJ [Pseudomonas sp. AB6]MEA9997125.1 flagellar assembly peptidoglycan hydrolase FlgJ [Pseudomonas sp. AA4]MEB0087314.1 flagellar assembly peptidoglycan hydrolase FlgJ [Pseudomonas sp. RTI1]MEB0128101.1 flagellar assembly peptidoglycan hydrolase FlgJ [Pseudomonas sp. CCC1.2]MEB0154584.1 flagellar assembly peptidoglycan hydrolase FlgJ [Pseudomonas s